MPLGIDILHGFPEIPMPKKYQNPQLEKRKNTKNPYYFIRVSEPRISNLTGRPELRRVEKNLGLVADMTDKEAMRRRAEVLAVVNAHRAPMQSFVLFKDLARRYIEIRLPSYGVAMRAWEKGQIQNHIEPTFGLMRLSEITTATVEAWLVSKSKLSWNTRQGLKRIFGRMFQTAKTWKLWEGENPAAGTRMGRKTVIYERKLLSAEVLRAIIAKLSERPKFIVLIIFGCGLSISEVLGLKWSDIDFDQKTLTISRRWYRGDMAEQTKTEARSATLRLSASMLAEFAQRYPGPHKRAEYLFIGDDGANPPDEREILRYEFRPVVKKLGVYYKGFGWHAFRRQHITWRQTIGGASPFEAQKAARHASLDMSYLYTLTDHERETDQQQKMFDLLMGTVEGKKPT